MPRSRTVALAALADAVALVAFAAAGRRSHDEAGGLGGVLETAAPFLLGVAAAWLVLGVARNPLGVRRGAALWAVGIPLGLALRRLAFDRGVAPSFVVVALVVCGVLLVGWRAALAVAARRSRA